MKQVILMLIIIIGISNLNAQTIDGICNESDFFGVSINKLKYVRYSKTLIKDRYVEFSEVNNSTPELLLKSQMSVKDNNWLSFNYGKPMEWTPEQFSRINSPKNHIELLCKITLELNDEEYALVKLNLLNEDKSFPQFLSLVMKKTDKNWIILSDKTLSKLNFILMFTSVDDIDRMLLNNTTSNNTKLNEAIQISWLNNKLNLSRLINNVGELLIKSEYNEKAYQNSKEPDSDLEKEIDIDYLFPLNEQSFCYYFQNELSEFKEDDLDLILTYLRDKFKSEEQTPLIEPIHKFSYKKDSDKIYFIKYNLSSQIANGLQSEVFVIKDGTVETYEQSSDIDMMIINLIKGFKSPGITQFLNVEDNSEFPIINQLKKEIIRIEGVIDLKVFEDIIERNKNKLSKYIDD